MRRVNRSQCYCIPVHDESEIGHFAGVVNGIACYER